MSEYKEDLEIDIESLDVEWLRQPQLYRKYADLKAQAKFTLDRATENVKTIRSELILQARKGGEDLIGVKPTDSTVEAWYRSHGDYIEAVEEKNQAEYEYNMMDSSVFAFSHKKTALENMVSLWIGSYFSGPKEPRDSGAVKKLVHEKANSKQRSKLNKKKEKK